MKGHSFRADWARDLTGDPYGKHFHPYKDLKESYQELVLGLGRDDNIFEHLWRVSGHIEATLDES